jgi:hypothetical protein
VAVGLVAALGVVAAGLGVWVSQRRAAPAPDAAEAPVGARGRRSPAAESSEARARAIEQSQDESAAPGATKTRQPRTGSWLLPPPFGKPAGLAIALEHSLKSGRMRVFVDEVLVLDEELKARLRKQILIYKERRGVLEKTVEIEPGEHVIRVRVQSDDWMLNEEIKGRFERGVTRHLSVDVGGLLKKRLSLSWGASSDKE